MNHRNGRTGAIHMEGPGGHKTLCDVGLAEWFQPTDTPATCEGCKRIAREYTYEPEADPVYRLATDIGGDLPDGAFWALYSELGK